MPFQVTTPISHSHAGKISPMGSPAERLWIIAETPLPKDKDKGYLFSSAMGWSYNKLLGEAGLRSFYIDYFDPANPQLLVDKLNQYKPAIIITLDKSGSYLLPQIKRAEDINLWAGSLLSSDKLSYPHYIIPTFGPEKCISDWTERQVVKYIDLGKAKGELEFYVSNGNLNPLPSRNLMVDLDFYSLLGKLQNWLDKDIPYISVDIETVYPREKSEYYGHPGLPMTIGIAPSSNHGISFELFREDKDETRKLWRALANLLKNKDIIGQNFFLFDSNFFRMLGMPVNLMRVHDTMFRHAVLWPELDHTLAFLGRQYTREPYYKGLHSWKPGQLTELKRYNALDCCVTYEVFLAQEEEFNVRPHLR